MSASASDCDSDSAMSLQDMYNRPAQKPLSKQILESAHLQSKIRAGATRLLLFRSSAPSSEIRIGAGRLRAERADQR